MGHLSQIVGKSQIISRLMEYLWYNKYKAEIPICYLLRKGELIR